MKATFSPDTPDPELHELPQVCAHFVIDTDGTQVYVPALGEAPPAGSTTGGPGDAGDA